MPEPAETPLHEQHEQARNASSLKNLSIGYSVLPLDVQEASETAEMEAVEPLLLPDVGCPALDAIQKSAEDTGLVDTELGIYRQLAVLPDALAELGHNCSGLGNPGADFCIKGEGAGHCGAQVGERVHHFKGCAVDGDDRSGVCVLGQDVGLFDADSQAKLFAGMG